MKNIYLHYNKCILDFIPAVLLSQRMSFLFMRALKLVKAITLNELMEQKVNFFHTWQSSAITSRFTLIQDIVVSGQHGISYKPYQQTWFFKESLKTSASFCDIFRLFHSSFSKEAIKPCDGIIMRKRNKRQRILSFVSKK